MWKKTEEKDFLEPARTDPNPVEQIKGRASIGATICIQGDLTGEEDLTIQGRVEGKIDLGKHNVTVGKDAHIQADVYGRIISVEGHITGDLYGLEKIVIRQSGSVLGNLRAPRVNLEDGANFKGSIDMEAPEAKPGVRPVEKEQTPVGSKPPAVAGKKLSLGFDKDTSPASTR